MSFLLSWLSIFVLIVSFNANSSLQHNPIQQCCPDPVNAFLLRKFWGPCACQTLQQKWRRYVDWIEIEGGYVHPALELNYVHIYEPNMPSFDKGFFVYFDEHSNKDKISAFEPLLGIPLSISLSQFIISKYIKNATTPSPIFTSIPSHPMPDEFPDWREYTKQSAHRGMKGWMSLGFAWLKENTQELLPWISLLPPTDYLPITWNESERHKHLKGTAALRIIEHELKELEETKTFLKLLNVTQQQVTDAFVWISSRAFGENLKQFGGAKESLIIPCGVDFANHNLKSGQVMERTVEALEINPGIRAISAPMDKISNFLWLEHDQPNGSQIFINYDKEHSSADRLANYGFIDDVISKFDEVPIAIDLDESDIHFAIKEKYFKTVWNSTFIRMNLPKFDENIWQSLGDEERKKYFDQTKGVVGHKRIKRVFQFGYKQEKVLRVNGEFIRFLRLAFLPKERFDAFTINSILNDFEFDYLTNSLDFVVENALNEICSNLLAQYPTDIRSDRMSLRKVERKKKKILRAMKKNRNRNLTEMKMLREDKALLDREALVLKYRIREKEFVRKCTKMTITLSSEYLKSVKRRIL